MYILLFGTRLSCLSLSTSSYLSHTTEEITNFNTNIEYVSSFKPIKGIFNYKVSYSLLIITDSDIMIYVYWK